MRFVRPTLVLVLGLALAAAPGPAGASQSRVDALGIQSDYLQDYVNVTYYPSTIARYPNLVYGDFGIKDVAGGDLPDFTDNSAYPPQLNNRSRAMGAHVKLWKQMPGVFGVQLNENANAISPAYGAEYYNRNRNEGFTFLWGHKFAAFSLGATVSNSSSSFETRNQQSEPIEYVLPGPSSIAPNSRSVMNAINASLGLEPRNYWNFGVGASIDWSAYSRSHTADFAFHYRTMDLEREELRPGDEFVRLEDDDNYGMAFNGRVLVATSDNTYLTPVFNYWRQDLSILSTNSANPDSSFAYENIVQGWSLGLAQSWVLRESDLLVLGFSFGQQEVDYEGLAYNGPTFSAKYSQLPAIFGAAEIKPAGWLSLRFGAGKALSSKVELSGFDTTGGTTVVQDSPLLYALGAGFRIGGRLDLDVVINQDFPFSGGWFASGQEEVPFSRLSATYRF